MSLRSFLRLSTVMIRPNTKLLLRNSGPKTLNYVKLPPISPIFVRQFCSQGKEIEIKKKRRILCILFQFFLIYLYIFCLEPSQGSTKLGQLQDRKLALGKNFS